MCAPAQGAVDTFTAYTAPVSNSFCEPMTWASLPRMALMSVPMNRMPIVRLPSRMGSYTVMYSLPNRLARPMYVLPSCISG